MNKINLYLAFGVTYREELTGKTKFDYLGRTYESYQEAHQSFNESLKCLPGWATPIAFWKIKFKKPTA